MVKFREILESKEVDSDVLSKFQQVMGWDASLHKNGNKLSGGFDDVSMDTAYADEFKSDSDILKSLKKRYKGHEKELMDAHPLIYHQNPDGKHGPGDDPLKQESLAQTPA